MDSSPFQQRLQAAMDDHAESALTRAAAAAAAFDPLFKALDGPINSDLHGYGAKLNRFGEAKQISANASEVVYSLEKVPSGESRFLRFLITHGDRIRLDGSSAVPPWGQPQDPFGARMGDGFGVTQIAQFQRVVEDEIIDWLAWAPKKGP